MKILNSKAIKEIKQKVIEQWGAFPDLNLVFLRSGKGKLFVVNRDVQQLPEEKIRIDTIGLYFGEEFPSGGLRLSMEGAQLVGKVATKNTYEITEEHVEQWLQGKDLHIPDAPYGFLILTHKQDILGCGHSKEGKIANYVPKNRRIKEINPTFEKD